MAVNSKQQRVKASSVWHLIKIGLVVIQNMRFALVIKPDFAAAEHDAVGFSKHMMRDAVGYLGEEALGEDAVVSEEKLRFIPCCLTAALVTVDKRIAHKFRGLLPVAFEHGEIEPLRIALD